jgi:hypothetical protein
MSGDRVVIAPLTRECSMTQVDRDVHDHSGEAVAPGVRATTGERAAVSA